jgi:hypothetical protein
MKLHVKTQYIIMTFALHYRAMIHCNIYSIRIHSSVLKFKNLMFRFRRGQGELAGPYGGHHVAERLH